MKFWMRVYGGLTLGMILLCTSFYKLPNIMNASEMPEPTLFYCNTSGSNRCFFDVAFENDASNKPADTRLKLQAAIDKYMDDPGHSLPTNQQIEVTLGIDDSIRQKITLEDIGALAMMGKELETTLQKSIIMKVPVLDLSRFTLHPKDAETLSAQTFADHIFVGYEKVILPEGITTISANAFSGQAQSANVTLIFPASMNDVAVNAFASVDTLPYSIEFAGDATPFLANLANANIEKLILPADKNPTLTTVLTEPLKNSKIKHLDVTGNSISNDRLSLNALYGTIPNASLTSFTATEGFVSIVATGFANLSNVHLHGNLLSEIDVRDNHLSSIVGIQEVINDGYVSKLNISDNAIDYTSPVNKIFYDDNHNKPNYQMANQKPILKVKAFPATKAISSLDAITFDEPIFVYADNSDVDLSTLPAWLDRAYATDYRDHVKLQYYDSAYTMIEQNEITASGTYYAKYIYDGSTDISDYCTITLTLSNTDTKTTPTMSLAISPNQDIDIDDEITCAASLTTDENADLNSGAEVVFKIDGVSVDTKAMQQNKAEYKTKLTEGTHQVVVEYSGNADYHSATSNQQIIVQGDVEQPVKTTPTMSLAISPNQDIDIDDEITCAASLTTDENADLNSGAEVVFKIDGVSVDTKAMQQNKAEYKTKLTEGTHQVIAEYSGNTDYHSTSTTQQVIVGKPKESSTDTELKTLTLSQGSLTPEFDASITSYEAQVAYQVDKITIAATANKTEAVIRGDVGEVNLNVGETLVKINVKDGTSEKQYTINVHRKAEDKPINTKTELKSADESISVIGDFDDSYQVKIETKENVELQENYAKQYDIQQAFDIYITKDNVRYNLDQKVEVRIKRQPSWSKNSDSIMYIADDGANEIMPSTSFEEYISFTTTHFSTYAVVAKADSKVVNNNVETGSEDTTLHYLGGVLCSISLCGFLLKRWYQKETKKG